MCCSTCQTSSSPLAHGGQDTYSPQARMGLSMYEEMQVRCQSDNSTCCSWYQIGSSHVASRLLIHLPLITILYFAQAIDWERYAAVAGRFLPFLVFGTSVLGFMLHKYIGIQVRATRELKRRVQGTYTSCANC